jgi:hypothetical protein
MVGGGKISFSTPPENLSQTFSNSQLDCPTHVIILCLNDVVTDSFPLAGINRPAGFKFKDYCIGSKRVIGGDGNDNGDDKAQTSQPPSKSQSKTGPATKTTPQTQIHPTLSHVNKYLDSIRQPNQQYGIYDPITNSQYNYFKDVVPSLYKEDVCRAWFDFVQSGRGLGSMESSSSSSEATFKPSPSSSKPIPSNTIIDSNCLGGDKIEELWNFHFISTPELPSLLQQIQSDAIDFRLGLYQYAEAMAAGEVGAQVEAGAETLLSASVQKGNNIKT